MKQFYDTSNKLVINYFDNEYVLLAGSKPKNDTTDKASTGFYVGKFLVNFLGQGTILFIATLTGPLAPATFAALAATFTLPIEAASNIVGLGVGIWWGAKNIKICLNTIAIE